MDPVQAQRRFHGAIVRTSYGTGPYKIIDVHGPCDCPNAVDSLATPWGKKPKRSPKHLHFTCWEWIDHKAVKPKGGLYYLNGYRMNGTNVWSRDTIEILGYAQAMQLLLL